MIKRCANCRYWLSEPEVAPCLDRSTATRSDYRCKRWTKKDEKGALRGPWLGFYWLSDDRLEVFPIERPTHHWHEHAEKHEYYFGNYALIFALADSEQSARDRCLELLKIENINA